MSWQRGAAITTAWLFLAACGQAPRPVAVVTPFASPTPSAQASPTPMPSAPPSPSPSPKPSPSAKPSPEPTPPPAVATVACKGAPSAAMVVVAGRYLYDVTNPVSRLMVCTASNTYIQLAGATKLAYTVPISGGKTRIVWRDLLTGVNTNAALLPATPNGAKDWTFDGMEVYAGPGKPLDIDSELVPIHLVANGTDHILYSITSGSGGWESRWSPYPILDFSPNHTYVAISDSRFAITSSGLRIFSVVD